MDLGRQDRVILVNGSARSIGKAIAKVLLYEGCSVVICDIAVYNMNIKGTVRVTKEVLTYMRKQGWGRIINIAPEPARRF